MGTNLAGKEFVEAVVVGDGRDGGNVGGQGDGRERGTLPFIPPDELSGEVGRIVARLRCQDKICVLGKGRAISFAPARAIACARATFLNGALSAKALSTFLSCVSDLGNMFHLSNVLAAGYDLRWG